MNSSKRHTLPKNIILKHSNDIERVLKSGKRSRYQIFNFYTASSGNTGVAFLVSKRLGNATQRIRMKRLFREAYRLNRDKFLDREVIFYIKRYLDDYKYIMDQIKSVD